MMDGYFETFFRKICWIGLKPSLVNYPGITGISDKQLVFILISARTKSIFYRQQEVNCAIRKSKVLHLEIALLSADLYDD